MTSVPVEHGLLLAGIVFLLGLAGLLLRRNLLLTLVSLEILLNAAGLGFVVAGAHRGEADGQVVFIFILAVAGAEVAVALALVLLLHRRWRIIDPDAADTSKG